MDAGRDEEFKRIVAEMKPHAKKLPQKSSEERLRGLFSKYCAPHNKCHEFCMQLNDTE